MKECVRSDSFVCAPAEGPETPEVRNLLNQKHAEEARRNGNKITILTRFMADRLRLSFVTPSPCQGLC